MKKFNKNLLLLLLNNIFDNNLNKYFLYYLLILNLYATINGCEIWKASDCRGQPTAAEGFSFFFIYL